MAISESSVGSSSEVNLPVSFTTMESMKDKIEELDEIMENLDLEEISAIILATIQQWTSPLETAVSPVTCINYASSSLKQQKTTMSQITS
jgi:hypothetical protein